VSPETGARQAAARHSISAVIHADFYLKPRGFNPKTPGVLKIPGSKRCTPGVQLVGITHGAFADALLVPLHAR